MRWSLLMAVTNTRVVGWTLVKGSINSFKFSEFMANLKTDGRDLILLDNASIHKTHAVMDSIMSRGLTPVFLPPYTPEFQPIEHAFSVLKSSFRRNRGSDVECDRENDMIERVTTSLENLNPQILKNQFMACWQRAKDFLGNYEPLCG